MAKLRVLSGREVCKVLAANGFSEVRRKGSHIAMQKRVAVPQSQSQFQTTLR